MKKHRPIRKLLAANRSEIAIRIFRAANELGLRTVAIYSQEDRLALHRFKADEAYQVGAGKGPVEAYLDISGIIAIAKEHQVDAIHPGYGFLSENPALARACAKAGLAFVGPTPELLELLGDKTAARRLAGAAGVSVLPGTEKPVATAAEAKKIAAEIGYPMIVKAAKGGGGRGMRVVHDPEQLAARLEEARGEAKSAFGDASVFLEKYLPRARHIEVQILADEHGNLLHLYERDCSVQRRHQKVVEVAPAVNLPDRVRRELCEAAVALARKANYRNAGTAEFLYDVDSEKWYFIEVNPRIQVEHTVTEVVTGVDIVRAQILVAQGHKLHDEELALPEQDKIPLYGAALQCRVTTEDPEKNFAPDYGKISTYRSPAGFGIRLDGGTAYAGALLAAYYDSLLVKVTAWGKNLPEACQRMDRALREFRIRGVKTNIPFLENVVNHPRFRTGEVTTSFLDDSPELFRFTGRADRATKLLSYIGDVILNGNPEVKGKAVPAEIAKAVIPKLAGIAPKPGTRQLLQKLGPQKFAAWARKEKRLLLTDTTFRDAHQSLLATRVRTYAEVNQLFGDIVKVTPSSKVVGDMALFLLANEMKPSDVLELDEHHDLSLPNSVVEMFSGTLGVPQGGWPRKLQRIILRGQAPRKGRPGASLVPANFEEEQAKLEKKVNQPVERDALLSYLLYPDVYLKFNAFRQAYADVGVLPTPAFFYGLKPGEEIAVEIEPGKTMIVKFLTISEAHPDGTRTLFFELNGQPREVNVRDRALRVVERSHPKADPEDSGHVGAPTAGLISSIAVQANHEVERGAKLFTLEAMKMQSNIYAPISGRIAKLLVTPGQHVEAKDLLAVIAP